MKPTSLLVRLRSRCFPRWRAVPIFGPLLDDFVQWMHEDQNYTLHSASNYLSVVPTIVRWLRERQVRSLSQLTLQHLKAADRYFRPRHQATSWAVRVLERFLRSQGTVAEGPAPVPTPAEVEVDAFSDHLRGTRGLAEKTIQGHGIQVRAFLRFLQFDCRPSQLQHLQPRHIEAFLCQVARTNNRFSLQHVVATVRGFLQWRHARGLLSRPLHLQIDTPRVYRGERLPQALPREQVQALLQSIDRSDSLGNRDFTIVYLAAAYGLRSGEVVRLSLDDLDWRRRTLRIRQTKTRQTLQLPLTDEAANVLIRYLRQGRPPTAHRELFLRTRAPRGPLRSPAVREILARRIRRSGLDIPPCGTNVLRHYADLRTMPSGMPARSLGSLLAELVSSCCGYRTRHSPAWVTGL